MHEQELVSHHFKALSESKEDRRKEVDNVLGYNAYEDVTLSERRSRHDLSYSCINQEVHGFWQIFPLKILSVLERSGTESN